MNWRDVLDADIVAQCSQEYLHLLGYNLGNRELFNPGAMQARAVKQRAAAEI